MARVSPRRKAAVRKPATPPAEVSDGMLLVRGNKNLKPPTPAQIQRMKELEFIRKNPTTST